jgi:hypothetical protein
VHKIALPVVEQAGRLLQLLCADPLGQEGDDIFYAAFVYPQYFQRVANG